MFSGIDIFKIQKKKPKKIQTFKIDFECQILALSNISALHLNTKYNKFFRVQYADFWPKAN
jgi:hypothetical protein